MGGLGVVPVVNPKKGSGAAKSGAGSGAQKFVPSNVRSYENGIRMATMKFAIGEYCRDMNRARSSGAMNPRSNYLSAFKDIVGAHFWYRKECIKVDGKKWVNMVQTQSQKRKMQAALEGLEVALGQLEEPCAVTVEPMMIEPSDKATSNVDAKESATAIAADGSPISPEMSSKCREMEAAAAKGDYITAGRIQSQMELSTKVQDLIVSRTKEMDDAAAKKDYVEAGRLQLIVKHLECIVSDCRTWRVGCSSTHQGKTLSKQAVFRSSTESCWSLLRLIVPRRSLGSLWLRRRRRMAVL